MTTALRICFIFLVISPMTSAAAEPVTVRGRVILDKNANGQLDADEKGLSGVAITDGMQLVSTGDDGSFEIKTLDDPVLPYKPAQVVSVSWGTGYWPTGLWYRRLADIKPGEVLMFGLRPDEQKTPFAMVQTTDPHNNFTGELSQGFRDEVKRLGSTVNFAIVTGDLGYAGLDSADAMFSAIQGFTRSFPITMFTTPGNHDVVAIHTVDWKKQSELHGSGAYTKYLGPIRWSFDYAGCHFVGLDWVYEEKDGKLEGGVPKTCIEWLEKDFARLKPGTRIFPFCHSQWCPNEKFYDLLRMHKMELFLAGHSHQNLDVSSDGLKMLTTVNLLGKEAPFRVLHVYEGGHDVVDRCAGTQPNHRRDCELCVPGPIPSLRRETVELANQTVADKQAIKVGNIRAPWIELEAEFAAPATGTCGVRLTSDDPAVKPVEVRFEKNSLVCGGLTVPEVRLHDADKYRLRIHALNGYLQVRVNDRVHFERPLPTDKPWGAELISAGGSANFSKVQLWKLIDDDPKLLEDMVQWHGYGRQARQVKEYREAKERLKSK